MTLDKGVGRDEAYRTVQGHAMQAWQNGDSFRDLVTTDPKFKGKLSKAEIEKVFDPEYYVRHVQDVFKRLGL